MKDSKLQYLIELVDDESSEVRTQILKELGKYGTSLEKDILDYANILNPDKMKILQPVIETNRREWLKEHWNVWHDLENDFEKIEIALNLLSKFQYGIHLTYNLSVLLDELTEEFKNRIPYGDELDLATFLFQEKSIAGAKDDYYNPFNSNPIYSIKEKKGLPITLALIYVLIGWRLGFSIKGCNFPGHFLAKVEKDDEIILIDCFNGGKFFYESDIVDLVDLPKENIEQFIRGETSTVTIIRRVLSNLINSYSILNDYENQKFFSKLLQLTV